MPRQTVVDGKISVAGMDVGFRKTGVAIFSMTEFGDVLTAATTVCPDEVPGGTMCSDVSACWNMEKALDEYLDLHKVVAVFAEFPTGGAQSGRAARCMGMSTALCASLFYGNHLAFDIYVPDQIEKALGFYITRQEKTKLGLSGGKLRERRKELLQKCVTDEYPEFEGWPEKKATREDAFDAAAAFLAGRKMGDDCLYARLRRRLITKG